MPRPMYYKRNGEPYSDGIKGSMEWGADFKNPAIKLVKQETLPNGLFVSTVWLGIDHNHYEDDGQPIIFETMVFQKGDEEEKLGEEVFCDRYSTEAEALEGHKAVVERFSKETSK